jgi:Flp pilus assembly protein TadG
MMLIFGGIKLTRVMMLRHSIDHAASVAARSAIVSGATADAVIDRAKEHLAIVGIRDATITLDPATIEESTSMVSVHVAALLASNSFGVPSFVTGTLIATQAGAASVEAPANDLVDDA